MIVAETIAASTRLQGEPVRAGDVHPRTGLPWQRFYATLHRMVDDGLLERCGVGEYKLTDTGWELAGW
jgi:DNA-binding IclR family transcriptional regulator